MNQKKHKNMRRVLKLLYFKVHKAMPDKDTLRIIEKEAKRRG